MTKYKPYQIVIIIAGLLLLFLGRFIPLSASLSPSGTQVLFIMAAGLIMWLFVGVDWTSMAVLLALALVPELGLNTVAAGSLGNNTVFYLILCFMLAKSLEITGVARRLAVIFMTSSLSRKNPWNTVAMLFLSIFVLSAMLNASSVVMIFLPILYAIFDSLGYSQKDNEKFPGLMIISLIIITQIAQASTPISHAMTLIGFSTYESYTGTALEFGQYCLVAIPATIIAAVLWFLVCRFILKPDISRLNNLDYDALKQEIGPMKKQETIAIIVYLIVIVFWLAPSISKYALPSAYPILSRIHQCFPPMIALIVLNFIRIKGKPVLPYKTALSAVPFNTIMFMGALLMLGSAMSKSELGVSTFLSETLSILFKNIPPMVFAVIISAMAIILTNFMSNAVTCAICMAVAMPLAMGLYAGQINPATYAALISIGINYAWATAPATPPAAIIQDSGWISPGNQLKYGMIAAVTCILSSVIILPLVNIIF